ncbi:MAG: AAA family ATPase [Candidatus Thermoplasmatota archaeon]|nr:AAA family ATPase [Candidatus Thermoplasmatota archaeon]
MSGWLVDHSPRTFDEFAAPSRVIERVTAMSLLPQPPHLLITGPPGCGKTALWRLYARQVLGPTWTSTVHVMNIRDMKRKSGATASFETFLRPEGTESSDTLAGRMSLAAFSSSREYDSKDDPPPAGTETESDSAQSLSRLIILEDADHMSMKWQAYLRRMLETVGPASRFIFTARAPSAIIDALRSRTQMIRLPPCDDKKLKRILNEITHAERITLENGVIDDILYVSQGNIRRAIFMLELLWAHDKLSDRSSIHDLIQGITMKAGRDIIEMALQGKVVGSRWLDRNGRRIMVRTGAVAEVDRLLDDHGLEPEDVIDQIHSALVGRRLPLDDILRSEILQALAKCSRDIQLHTHARIHFEHFLHRVAEVGRNHIVTT